MRLSSCSAPRGRRTRRRRNRLTLGRCEGSQLGHYDIITLLDEGGVGLNEGGTTLPDTPRPVQKMDRSVTACEREN